MENTERGQPHRPNLDWGDYWEPSVLPDSRSAPSMAEWFSQNVKGLMQHVRTQQCVAVGGGDDKPFLVVGYDMEGWFGVDRPLIDEMGEHINAFRTGDGAIHEDHIPGLRKNITDLIAYLQTVLAEMDETPPR